MRALLLLTLLPLSAFAQDMECREVTLTEKLMNFIPAKQCPSDDELISKRVTAEYNQYYGSLPQIKDNVKGHPLRGSAKEIAIAKEMLGEKPPKDWKFAAQNCDTVLCAFTNFFKSKDAAMQVMNIKAKSGYVLSLDQKINGDKGEQPWRADEVRELDAGLSKIPKELRNLSFPKIKRLADGLRFGDDSEKVAAFARPMIKDYREGEIVVYDTGMNNPSTSNPYESTSWPQEMIIHEICHHHDFKGYYSSAYAGMTSEQKNSSWAKLSGWKETTDAKGKSEWKAKKDAKFVSWYAETEPAEDYAESCMNFILHPETLKEKAPEKYAWMKQNVFKNKEFTGEEWTKDKVKNWPSLNNLIADESACNAKLAECMKDVKLSFWPSIVSQVQTNKCFSEFKKETLQSISTSLGSDPKYCDYGGQSTIYPQLDKVCGKSVKELTRVLDAGMRADLTRATSICEAMNDFTSECVLQNGISNLNAPKEIVPLMGKLLGDKVSDRMTALGKKMDQTKTSTWLPACLQVMSRIDLYNASEAGTGKKSKIFGYSSVDPSVKPAYVGNFISYNYESNDTSKTCAQAVITSLQKEGIKIPESGVSINVMRKPFFDEFKSFENEVMMEIKTAVKGCLFGGCKDEKVFELLTTWEQKNPQKRGGIATKEFAAELREKVK